MSRGAGSSSRRGALLLVVLAGAALPPAVAGARVSSPYRPGVVVVGFKPGVPAWLQRRLERRAGGRWKHPLGTASRSSRAARRLERRIGTSVVVGVGSASVPASVRLLRRYSRWVRYAEPDYLMEASAANRVPNDPSFSLQWGSLNTGQLIQGVAGTAGADDHAAAAWTVTTGSPSVVIGEVDTGVDYTHPDLAANVWTNPGGIGGCPAGTHGYNVVASTCNPMDDDTAYGGHGTHVAGIMGATGNNGVGVAGVNWSTTILPVKWLDSNASGSTSQLISALDWVVKAKQAGVNVRVVNDSATFVGTAYSQALSDEIDLLGTNNILFVTAAGNTGQDDDNPAYTRYPCGYDRPTEICVTATDQNDLLPTWANWGATKVDMAAPGASIYSTLRNGTYGYINGGSMAAAQVSGAAALALSTGDMTTTALRADILNNVDPLPALAGKVRTGGRLDICKAVPGCGAPPTSPPVNTGLPVISGVAQVGQTLTASSGSWSNGPTSFAYAWQRCDSSGANCAGLGASGSSYVVQLGDLGFTLRVVVIATNAAGPSSPVTSTQTTVVAAAPSTFGTTSVGSLSDTFAADRKRVNAYSLVSAGSVSKLSIYLAPSGTSGQQAIKGVIYADAGGAPGTLLGTSTQLTFSSGGAAGWYDLTFSSPVALAAGRYWVGVITGATSGVASFRYTSISGARDYNLNTFTAGPSSPFGAPTVDAKQMSEYATYTPSAPPTSPPVNTGLPVISGVAQVGQTLTASSGSWSNGPTSFAYAWQRCDSSGANCAGLGASGSSYVPVVGDVGSTLRVVVIATNAAGPSSPATSTQSPVVSSAPSTATFGTTTVGSSSDTFAADRKRVNIYSLPSAGSVSKLSIYLAPSGTSGQQAIKGVIYSDSGAAPAALLGTSTQLTFSSTGAAGWYDLTFSSPVALAAGRYWVGVITGATSGVASFRYTNVSNSRDYNANPFTSGPTNPFGQATVDGEQMSLYATYALGG